MICNTVEDTANYFNEKEFIHLQIYSFWIDFLIVLYIPYLYYGDLFVLIISETSSG